jgi:hypothetical protein
MHARTLVPAHHGISGNTGRGERLTCPRLKVKISITFDLDSASQA